MKFTDQPPTDGTQFVAVWTFNGKLWSGTYKYRFVDGRLMVYNEATEDWDIEPMNHTLFRFLSATFVIPS